MTQFPALLTIKEGEKPYKCLTTEWLVDSDGPVMFRFISKLRQDGEVELVLFTQRQDNKKYVLEHISFSEDEFLKAIGAIREMIWKFFPDVKIEIEDFTEMETSSYHALPANKLGLIWINAVWRIKAIINKLRWLFFKKPPQ